MVLKVTKTTPLPLRLIKIDRGVNDEKGNGDGSDVIIVKKTSMAMVMMDAQVVKVMLEVVT